MLWLHRYLRLLTAASLFLIAAGGLVTSTGSGLSVPDWPNSYGYFMFAFPLSNMVGGIFYEHGHRLIASTVGMMTIGLALWISRVDTRPWIRRLGWLALVSVCVQGLLGGITVMYFLPAPVSISHAGLAQLFFALVVGLSIFTSPGWHREYHRDQVQRRALTDDLTLRRLAVVTPFLVFGQMLVGATMRHTGAGLAIPDFPLSFGRLIPPVWDAAIGVHYAHRVGALVVSTTVVALTGHILAHHRKKRELARPALLLSFLVVVQVGLGAWTVLSERDVAVNTAHVASGAVLFVTSIVLALRVHRDRFPDATKSHVAARNPSVAAGRLTPQGSSGATP